MSEARDRPGWPGGPGLLLGVPTESSSTSHQWLALTVTPSPSVGRHRHSDWQPGCARGRALRVMFGSGLVTGPFRLAAHCQGSICRAGRCPSPSLGLHCPPVTVTESQWHGPGDGPPGGRRRSDSEAGPGAAPAPGPPPGRDRGRGLGA